MVELQCPRCQKTFERRGFKRGKAPLCNPCRESDDKLRIENLVKAKNSG